MGWIIALLVFAGPGVLAGLAVVRPRRYFWPAILFLLAIEYWLWTPDFTIWMLWHIPIGFSVALGLFCGLLCTGRQHQDKEA